MHLKHLVTCTGSRSAHRVQPTFTLPIRSALLAAASGNLMVAACDLLKDLRMEMDKSTPSRLRSFTRALRRSSADVTSSIPRHSIAISWESARTLADSPNTCSKDERAALFREYWDLASWDLQTAFIMGAMQIAIPKIRSRKTPPNKKTASVCLKL